MVTKEQALAYGKKIGVKYLVEDDNGTLYGGTKNREDAERIKSDWDEKNRNNPWIDRVPKICIREVAS